VTYTVTTERYRSEVEKFTNFFTNRKQTAAIRGTSNTDEQHAPQQSVSGAKLQKVTEYNKLHLIFHVPLQGREIKQRSASSALWYTDMNATPHYLPMRYTLLSGMQYTDFIGRDVI